MKIYLPFLLGYITHACIISLYMDFLGKDGTIKSMQDTWISAAITIPIALIILGASLATIIFLSIWIK